MSRNGIIHQSLCIVPPQQNDVAECKNRHMLEVARALLFHMNVPKYFWADVVHTAFLVNRLPLSILNGHIPYFVLSPPQFLFPIAPKIFGCTCFVEDVRPRATKLDQRSLKCAFVGYSRTHGVKSIFWWVLSDYL